MLSVISQAKVFVESQAAKGVNCMQKTLAWVLVKSIKSEYSNFFLFIVMFACIQGL
jgi:hypothetical protein